MLMRLPFRVPLAMGIGLLAVLSWQGCGQERYKIVVDAAEAGFGSVAMADYRHQRQLQDVLLAEPGFSGLVLKSYVFMDHGYVVGHVHNPEQAEAVYRAASKVEGLRSVNAFLPVKRPSTSDTIEKVTSDENLKAQIETALARTPDVVDTRIQVEVLDDRAVLLGVVSDNDEKTRAEHVAASTIGVKRTINWLLLPETDYLAARSQVF